MADVAGGVEVHLGGSVAAGRAGGGRGTGAGLLAP